MSHDLRRRAVTGTIWTGLQASGQQVIDLLVFLILARLLNPKEFGLVAMAMVFIALLNLFLDQGFAEAIIQRAEITAEHLDTVFWINLATAGLLAFLGIAFSGIIAGFYKEPLLVPIVKWLSFSFVLGAFASTQQAVLLRNLQFRSLAQRTLLARAAGGSVAIVAAINGLGVWSLVAQTLVSGSVEVFVLWRASSWRPRFRFSFVHFQELFRFGLSILGNKLLSYLNRRMVDLIIGFFLGATLLGYYTVAYGIVLRATNVFNQSLTPVVLSTFSKLQKDLESLQRSFYQLIEIISLVVFPVFVGFAVTAPYLVNLLFGQQWNDSILLMQVLSFYGLAWSFLTIFSAIFIAKGNPGLLVLLKLVGVIAIGSALMLVVRKGLLVSSITIVLTTYSVMGTAYLWALKKIAGVELRLFFVGILVPATSSIFMALGVLFLNLFIGNFGDLVRLSFSMLIGGGIYLLSVYLIDTTLLHKVRILLSLIQNRGVGKSLV